MSGQRAGRARLIIVWSVVALLLGVIAVDEMLERNASQLQSGDQPREAARWVLPVPLDQLHAIEIAHGRALHRFERDAHRQWFYHGAHGASAGAHAHPPDAGRTKRIDETLQGLARARNERALSMETGVEQFGLALPRMLILFYGQANAAPITQLAVGDIAPDKVSRYVLPVGGAAVVTIANFHIENLIALIEAMHDPVLSHSKPHK
jgi:Domain of unknown function (DUF4340)